MGISDREYVGSPLVGATSARIDVVIEAVVGNITSVRLKHGAPTVNDGPVMS
jgi:hypothetical protein